MARRALALLDRRERLQLGMLLLAALAVAFLELVAVAAVLPFLTVAADPALVHENPWLQAAYRALGFESVEAFLIALGCAALAALVLSNGVMAMTVWARARFAYGRVHSIGRRLLRHYAAQPYAYFLRRNGAELGKNVLAEVEAAVDGALLPALQLVTRAAVTLAIVAVLVAFDPLLALVTTAVIGGAYAAIFLAVRHRLTRLGRARVAADSARYKATSELFGAIKDIKLLGCEQEIAGAFDEPSLAVARQRASTAAIGQLPRYALEVIAFGGVLVIALYLLARGDGLQQMLPVLGLYAFAGYRLMPCLQEAFHALTRLRFDAPAVERLHRELTGGIAAPPCTGDRTSLPLCRRLELDGVGFAYPGTARPVLLDVSLAIEADSTVGIIGRTGAGKTTLLDLILGLLRPQRGVIRIDGIPLGDGNLRAWQSTIGYVPQDVRLVDDTIARNIALGVPEERIDMAAVERAARLAQIHGFVTGELPAGYRTGVGERGVRLSGGQRQRLGIARALYRDPSVLVLDEPTSALDAGTEAAVMEALERLGGTRTIIVVAHRPTTLAACDVVLDVDRGISSRSHEPGALPTEVDRAAFARAAS